MLPPAGTSIVNDTGPVAAKSSGPSADPSGLVPNRSVAAASAGRAARSVCVDKTGPAAPRPGPAPVVAAPAAGGPPRPAGTAARVTIRGLRQMTTGVVPGAGFTSANVRNTLVGPATGGPPRPRPARAPTK